MQPYYSDDLTTLYHGDCLDLISDTSGVDAVITSPPYNLGGAPWPHLGNWKPGDSAGSRSKWRNGSDAGGGITYADHGDSMPWPEYVAWQHAVLSGCWDALSPRGAIFYNHKPRVIGGLLWTPLELNPGLPLRQVVIWARAGGINFTPVAYVPTHEWVMVLAKPAFRLRSKGASGVGDVWRITQDGNNPHPAPFPIGLPAQIIDTAAPRLVLDPFAGSGTTLRAAKDAGVRSIGIERSEAYCEMAAQRLAQESLDFDRGYSDTDHLTALAEDGELFAAFVAEGKN
jgi:DNA modification methylase